MADGVIIKKVLTEYADETQEFPYTLTIFADLSIDGTPVTDSQENTGVTFATWEDFYDSRIAARGWTVDN